MRTLRLHSLALLMAITPLVGQETIPPVPASHVLDQANVLLPEAATRLSGQLLAAKRDGSVAVFLVTVPSLNTTVATQIEKLEALGKQFSKQWTKDVRGAVILFDDESGKVTVVFSKEALDTFSELELDQALKGPLMEVQKGGAKRDKNLDRDKLEHTTTLVVDTLKAFQQKAHRKDRKLWLLFGGIAAIVVIAVGLELLLASSRRRSEESGNKAGD